MDYFYNQGWQMLEERVFDDQAQPVESHAYVWSPRYVDALILRDWYDDEGALDADERLYYLSDANFNVTALVGLVGQDWTVVERYVYDPYGKTTVYDADWSTNPQSPIPNPFRYCGYFFDAETSTYNVRWRIYHPTLSTWLTRDPINYDAGDPNLYRYVGNSPTNVRDPSGLGPGWCYYPLKLLRIERIPGSHWYSLPLNKYRSVYEVQDPTDHCSEGYECPPPEDVGNAGNLNYGGVLTGPVPGLVWANPWVVGKTAWCVKKDEVACTEEGSSLLA